MRDIGPHGAPRHEGAGKVAGDVPRQRSSHFAGSSDVRIARAVLRAAASMSVTAALLVVPGNTSLLDRDASRLPRATTVSGPAHHAVVALGDSVPAGAACSCDPFPASYAALLSRRTRTPVTVANEAISGLDTIGLLAQIKEERKVADAVRQADVVLVTIGANDFGDHHDQVLEGSCTTGQTDCVSDEMVAMRATLTKVLGEIRALRQGRSTSVLVTGYWNVFEDGEVAQRASGAAGRQASITLTRNVNAAISSVSATAGTHYVDLFEAFQNRGRDIDSLLAPDGDHPDAAGHALIAQTLVDAGLPGDA
jgi:lysophospholipase L1-like esterase